MLRIRAIVVTWNSQATIDRCIAGLRATIWDGELELVVVDNASTDGTTRDWAARHPSTELRVMDHNVGFAGGVNAAMNNLDRVDAVALVNPDAFVEPGWLTPLVEALNRDGTVGAACPKILFDEPDAQGRDLVNNVGLYLGPTWELHDRGFGEVDLGQYDQAEEVWGWCGGAVLLRRSYLEDVGLLDDRLFLYAEDADLAWRGRRLGWKYRYEPDSVVRHVHRASSGGRRTPLLDYLNRRNRLVVVTRHAGPRGATVAWARALGGIMVAAVTEVIVPLVRGGRPDLAPIRRRCRAAVDAARLLLGIPVPPPEPDADPAGASP